MKAYSLPLILIVLCPGAWCQATKTINSPCEASSTQDIRFLAASQPKLRAHFPASFSDADIEQIKCDGWRDFKKLHPDEPPDAEKFQKYLYENYGGLKISSEPDGATIQVDGKPWSDETDTESSCKVGIRHIRLTKPGYLEEAGDAVVKEGQWTTFYRALKKE